MKMFSEAPTTPFISIFIRYLQDFACWNKGRSNSFWKLAKCIWWTTFFNFCVFSTVFFSFACKWPCLHSNIKYLNQKRFYQILRLSKHLRTLFLSKQSPKWIQVVVSSSLIEHQVDPYLSPPLTYQEPNTPSIISIDSHMHI